MKHPDAYRGREVIVTAGYHEGFERMELTCFADRQAAAWVQFDPEVKGGQKLRSADRAFDNVVPSVTSLIWRFHGNPKGIPEHVKLSTCRQ